MRCCDQSAGLPSAKCEPGDWVGTLVGAKEGGSSSMLHGTMEVWCVSNRNLQGMRLTVE